MADSYAGLFPKDSPKNMRFAVNCFTAIGLGTVTDDLRVRLRTASKLVLRLPAELGLGLGSWSLLQHPIIIRIRTQVIELLHADDKPTMAFTDRWIGFGTEYTHDLSVIYTEHTHYIAEL
ncbi:hypothetical protein BZG36_05687 [Bifiguratus adelaidae]|uniref:Uncharacterized protein n=1 Tax=Bifiguratus adelaidae TaxID=1938954 RepID=A0A261XSU4_9FUNG|nr:hypothetical protein BZG36_05687 [Bifiguratus adelaidae]